MGKDRIETEQQTAVSVPEGGHGILSTQLTDDSPGYAWFDCEAEL